MPNDFITRNMAVQPDAVAPDGSEVRLIATTQRGFMGITVTDYGGSAF